MIRAASNPVFLALAGQPAGAAPMPAGAPAAAIAAIAALEKRVPLTDITQITLIARYIGQGNEIELLVPANLTRRAASRIIITWRWGQLWSDAEWYEPGWHPGDNFDSLAPIWRRDIWRALNPNARYCQPRHARL